MITFGSLFAGIGGLDLGLERAGMSCKWQVEIDDYATKVLEKHWPDVARFRDVRECHGAGFCDVADASSSDAGCGTRQCQGEEPANGQSAQLLPDASGGSGETEARDYHWLEPVDLICGGFPCQDVSLAGKRAGLAGKRTTLWSEFARLIRELRPRWVLAENVPGLFSSDSGRFFGGILRDLAESGYDAEWDCIPAAAVGAPHRRYRVFIVGHAVGSGRPSTSTEQNWPLSRQGAEAFTGAGLQQNVAHANKQSPGWLAESRSQCNQWSVEPDVGRVAHGIPKRVDRLRCLGNAVVPQVAEWIGRRIVEVEG